MAIIRRLQLRSLFILETYNVNQNTSTVAAVACARRLRGLDRRVDVDDVDDAGRRTTTQAAG